MRPHYSTGWRDASESSATCCCVLNKHHRADAPEAPADVVTGVSAMCAALRIIGFGAQFHFSVK